MATTTTRIGDEPDAAFQRMAEERWATLATGETANWDTAKAWVEATSRGEHPVKPVARKLSTWLQCLAPDALDR